MNQLFENITSVKSIGERIKERRAELGLTQPQLAKLARVSPGTIGNVESGYRGEPRRLIDIAEALGVTPQWLRSGEAPKLSAPQSPAPPAPTIYTPDAGTGQALEKAMLAIGQALNNLDSIDRENASNILRHLALHPERASEFAQKMGRLLGESDHDEPTHKQKVA